MLDVLGLGDLVGGLLGRLVGVQRPLVVGVGAGVELAPGHLAGRALELLAERGDVLEGELAHRRQLGLLALERPALVGLDDRDDHARPRRPASARKIRNPMGSGYGAGSQRWRRSGLASAHPRMNTHRGQPLRSHAAARGRLRAPLRPAGSRGASTPRGMLQDAEGEPVGAARRAPSWCTWTASPLGRRRPGPVRRRRVTITAYEAGPRDRLAVLGRVRPQIGARLRLPASSHRHCETAGRPGRRSLLTDWSDDPRPSGAAADDLPGDLRDRASRPRSGILDRTVRRGYPRG